MVATSTTNQRTFAFSPWGCDSLDRLRYWLQTADAWRSLAESHRATGWRWLDDPETMGETHGDDAGGSFFGEKKTVNRENDERFTELLLQIWLGILTIWWWSFLISRYDVPD